MSKWFVLCTVFGSLFIVAGKRYAELREIGEGAGEVRPTLETYTPAYLRGVLTMSCGAAIISYCLWALETKELAGTDLPFYELSIVPMLTAMLRYLLSSSTATAALRRRSSPAIGCCSCSAWRGLSRSAWACIGR